MEQIKIKDINLFKGFDGTLQMSILIDGQFTAKAQNAVENAKERLTNGKDVGIVVDRLKNPKYFIFREQIPFDGKERQNFE